MAGFTIEFLKGIRIGKSTYTDFSIDDFESVATMESVDGKYVMNKTKIEGTTSDKGAAPKNAPKKSMKNESNK